MLRNILRALEGILRALQGPFVTDMVAIPGIGTAAAYATGDAFGDIFAFNVPKRGTISHVVFLDFDDEGIEKDLVLCFGAFTHTTDNSAFTLADIDLPKVVGVVNVADFTDLGSNRVGMTTPALGYRAPSGRLWGQLITRGADNIAAGKIPHVFLVVL